MKYYIDVKEIFPDDFSVRFIHSKGDKFIICGMLTTQIVDEENFDFVEKAKEKYGIDFLIQQKECSANIYSIPYVNVFAEDENGFYAIINDFPNTCQE